jgi:hypothetical protein
MSEITTCGRCGRELRSAKSKARGMGATCARRARAEATFTEAQVEKAHEVISDRAIARVGTTAGGRPLFRVVAADGASAYLSTRLACTCKAGQHRRPCYHRLASVLAA